MSKTEKFFRALAWFGLGAMVGFLLAPIKKGVDISICSNNVGTDAFHSLTMTMRMHSTIWKTELCEQCGKNTRRRVFFFVQMWYT